MIHNTHFAQYIPPCNMHFVTGTWSDAAGAVAGTIVKSKAAAAETSVINIPIQIPSNSVALQGAKLASIEIDFVVATAALTTMTAVVNKVTRGADGAVATVAAQTFTYDTGHDAAAERVDVDEHKMTLTITTPFWLDNDEYVLVELTAVCALTSVLSIIAAVANFTLRA